MPPSEHELCRKLLTELHLSVPERGLLPRGRARFSVVVAVDQQATRETGWFPRRILPDETLGANAVIEARKWGFLVHSQYETGALRFGPIVSKRYWRMKSAVRAYIRRYGHNEIDGVPIDWNA
jgi:hypothetical protein